MDKRIKILITTTNFDTAGSGKVIYDLVNGLDKVKFNIEIACEHSKGSFFETVKLLGLPIHLLPTKTHYRPYYTLFSRLKPISKFIKEHNYDIVHSWQWSSDWTEALATKLGGSKWIYTKKAMGFQNKHWKIKSYLANFIITINNEMYSYFPKKKNQLLIPLGIDIEYYAPKKVNPNTNEFRIITVANLVPVKGIEVLLRAIEQLKNENVFLTVLGDCNNQYGAKMKALSKLLGIDGKVSFLGKKDDVRPYINESNLYVIPTLDEGRKEGMPMALVEAMSMGVPVLGSNISGIKFVLKDFKNLLFEAGNSNALKSKILEIKKMEQFKREALGGRLREYCIANFSLKKFIVAHEDLYLKIMNE